MVSVKEHAKSCWKMRRSTLVAGKCTGQWSEEIRNILGPPSLHDVVVQRRRRSGVAPELPSLP